MTAALKQYAFCTVRNGRPRGRPVMKSMGTAAALCAIILAAAPAQAVPLSASFAGIANERTYPTNIYPNVPITGTFSFDVSNCQPVSGGSIMFPSCYFRASDFSFTVSSQYISGSPLDTGGLLSVINTPTSQTIQFLENYANDPHQSTISLVGPANGFLNGTDFQSLHSGPVNISQSSMFIDEGSSAQGRVALTSVTFAAVPEPASATLLATLSIVGCAARFRSRTTRSDCEHDPPLASTAR